MFRTHPKLLLKTHLTCSTKFGNFSLSSTKLFLNRKSSTVIDAATQPKQTPLKIIWVEASKNKWKAPLLDVTPYTHSADALSEAKKQATNVSYEKEDGSSFMDKTTVHSRVIPSTLEFKIDRMLLEGTFFKPVSFGEQWALYYRQNRILCVRRWTNDLHLAAEVEQINKDKIAVTKIHGVFTDPKEDQDFTNKALEYLLCTHAMGVSHPVPLLPDMHLDDPQQIASWCFQMFGPLAWYAVPLNHYPKPTVQLPLRTFSLFHHSVQVADKIGVETFLNKGIPVDILSNNGYAPIHYAMEKTSSPEIAQKLLEAGASVDTKSARYGLTPLMVAIEQENESAVTFLLEHNADPNIADARGFTALHKAAEAGQLAVVKMLLERGANPQAAAHGHTAFSLAVHRDRHEVADFLESILPKN